MIDKYFEINNKNFVNTYNCMKREKEKQRKLIREFFEKHGIIGNEYYISADGIVNRYFDERLKKNINLHIPRNEENLKKFGRSCCKSHWSDMAKLRAGCKLLKEFQDECVKRQIVINFDDDWLASYFNELSYLGYSYLWFTIDETKIYLHISSERYNKLTPKSDGFKELKASEFYKIKEQYESGLKSKENNND